MLSIRCQNSRKSENIQVSEVNSNLQLEILQKHDTSLQSRNISFSAFKLNVTFRQKFWFHLQIGEFCTAVMYFQGFQESVWSFSYFPNFLLYHWGAPNTFQNFGGYVAILSLTSKVEPFIAKNGNNWELFLTVVTGSFVSNVTGLIEPTLKHIDKFRFRQ